MNLAELQEKDAEEIDVAYESSGYTLKELKERDAEDMSDECQSYSDNHLSTGGVL